LLAIRTRAENSEKDFDKVVEFELPPKKEGFEFELPPKKEGVEFDLEEAINFELKTTPNGDIFDLEEAIQFIVKEEKPKCKETNEAALALAALATDASIWESMHEIMKPSSNAESASVM
jgi:hypothetical protein